MENLNELLNLLSQMDENLEKLLTVENEKTLILEKGKVDELNELMNTEQALIMKCSADEKQRIKLCEKMNSNSISDLVSKYPEVKGVVDPLHLHMVETIDSIKKASKLNLKLVDIRMNTIQLLTAQFGLTASNTTYGKNAQKV